MKSKRIKPQPLKSSAEFLSTIVALTTLEATKRKMEAERDLELQALNRRFDARLDPVLAEIKGRMALAETYAEEHRKELLPPKAKSAIYALARFGWREGNRKVALLARVTPEQAIAALKALGLDEYVRKTEELAKDKLLGDCKDDKTLPYTRPEGGQMVPVALADVGLKITQTETFYVEPTSEAADAIKAGEAA